MLDSSPLCVRTSLFVALLACALGACTGGGPEPGNLLRGARPSQVLDVRHAGRISDGLTPQDGDPWLTDLSAVFRTPRAHVVYDLGRVTRVDAAFLQADNNDRFVLAVSEDGRTYSTVWLAPAAPGAGMRPRLVAGLGARGRYLRLSAQGGDPLVSVGELLVFAEKPQAWPPHLAQRAGMPLELLAQRGLVGLGVALLLLFLLADRRVPAAVLVLAGLLALAVAALCASLVVDAWPPPLSLGEVLRAVIAACAALVLIGWSAGLRPRRFVASGLLGVLALLGIVCFYNFSRPWFWNAQAGRPTPVHTNDMRVYFPVAKYFDELGFDGVYVASLKAYLVGERLPSRAIATVALRDLRSNRLVLARDVMDEIEAVPKRFTEQRFAEFVRDMRFFWRTMGPADYLGTLSDHGGNATPVWLAIAHVLFRGVTASEPVLTLTSLLDPLLMLLAFVCIGRSFGLRTMLVCAIVFGASDLPMFGSDWAGSTLRFDWMATLALGCCALKTGRFMLGGALLAHAGLVRAFPAAALLFTPVPLVVLLVQRLVGRRRPSAFELLATLPGLPRVALGAALASVLLVGWSGALFGLEPAWGGWVKKIALHTEDANANHLGVRTLVGFDAQLTVEALAAAGVPQPWLQWQRTQLSTYQQRPLLAWLLRALFLLGCVLACRGASLEQAALLGMLLVPVFTYPANYYCHYVYLLPLLASGRRPALALGIELVLLLMCVGQYFTLRLFLDLRFFWESVILLGGFAALLVLLVAEAYRGVVPAVASKPAIPVSS